MLRWSLSGLATGAGAPEAPTPVGGVTGAAGAASTLGASGSGAATGAGASAGFGGVRSTFAYFSATELRVLLCAIAGSVELTA